ncbi:MAG: dienelactone hydrolase family protein [Acidimicrobiales bacterium]
MPTTRTETVTASDGGTFATHLTLPDAGEGPGILLLQEIFGVNDFLLGKAGELARAGYVVSCPDVFWRVQPGVSLPHDAASLQEAFGLMSRYSDEVPQETKVADLLAALSELQGTAEVNRGVAAMGYCLGGMLAYLVAAHGDVDALVSYYGSGIADMLDISGGVACPVLFQFGGSDPYIAREQIDAIESCFKDRPDVEVRVEPGAGHAFENLLAPQFADPDAASRSWPHTLAWLSHNLPAA